MTRQQEEKYHAAIRAILSQNPLRQNAHIYLVEKLDEMKSGTDHLDIWLRFTNEVETEVGGYRLYCLLTVLA